jgi:hypothetical protein
VDVIVLIPQNMPTAVLEYAHQRFRVLHRAHYGPTATEILEGLQAQWSSPPAHAS